MDLEESWSAEERHFQLGPEGTPAGVGEEALTWDRKTSVRGLFTWFLTDPTGVGDPRLGTIRDEDKQNEG